MDQTLDETQETAHGQDVPEGQGPPAPAGEALPVAPEGEATSFASTPSESRLEEATRQLEVSTAALAAGRWVDARRALVVSPEECATLPEALRERLAKAYLDVAAAAEAAEDWAAAADLLRQSLALGLGSEMATARLKVVRQREEGQSHLARAQAAFAAGRWQDCLEEAEAAVAGLPTSILARELRHSAVTEIENEERRRQEAALREERRRRQREALDRYVQTPLTHLGAKSASLVGQGVQLVSGLARDLRASKPPATPTEVSGPVERPAAQASQPKPSRLKPTRPMPPRPPTAGELPAGWEQQEEPGEAPSRNGADFGAAQGWSGAGSAKVAMARHYIAKHPAVDEAYCWLARHYLLGGHFEEGRQTLAEGLANCSLRRRLCQTYAWLELEAGRLNEAADWWLRSAQLQLVVWRLDMAEPFMYLAYLATFYGLAEQANRLFAVVDGIQHVRMSESGQEELRTLAQSGNKQLIVNGIRALVSRLDEAV